MSNLNSKRKYISFGLVTVFMAAMAFAVVAACTNSTARAKPSFVVKDPPKPGVVAKIGNEDITEDMLIGEDKLDFFDLKKREYELRMDRMHKLLEEKLIGAEAKKAGISVDDYISKKVVKGGLKISDSEYKKFVKDKHIPESQINPQIKERIFSYLQMQKRQDAVQAYVAKLSKSIAVEVYFRKPRMQVNVEIGQAPTTGNAKAPVTIVEFSDFQCPFCSRGADTVNEVKKRYGSKVNIAFRHFPLPMHKEARGASEASMCVNEQGSAKFWKYHDKLFKNPDKLDMASLERYAKDTGADLKKYKECMDAKKYKDHVQKDLEYGEKIGVKSTPTFFINGQILSGALPIDAFAELIDDELKTR